MSTTTEREYTERELAVIADYEAAIMSGKAFRNLASSTRSIIGYQPPAGRRKYAAAMALLARYANGSDKAAKIAQAAIQALPINHTPGESVAKVADAVREVLGEQFFDTMNAASPEPGRRSDNYHTHTLNDRLIAMWVVQEISAIYIPTGSVHGWCLQYLVKREGIPPHYLIEGR